MTASLIPRVGSVAAVPFTWGDDVDVQSESDASVWRYASVCALPVEGGDPRYLVEYGDGSDELVPERRLRPRPR
jgi:hypothetical protein